MSNLIHDIWTVSAIVFNVTGAIVLGYVLIALIVWQIKSWRKRNAKDHFAADAKSHGGLYQGKPTAKRR